MPRVIDPGEGDAISVEDLVEGIETSKADLRDEDGLASLAPLLARLARNPDFLADMAIAELEQRFAGQAGNAYGAQALMLRRPGSRYGLRANFWPARDDAVVAASGTSVFVYDLPHDHNFSFLTAGYQGPGYRSDDYVYDRVAVAGVPGEAAGLTFTGRSQLAPGSVHLYRSGRDVHVQIPPEGLSVSLNIIAVDRAEQWQDQYRFDPARGTIASGLTTAPVEGLVALAAHFGGEQGRDLVAGAARGHPVPRVRVTAIAALASAMPEAADRAALFARAADDADPYIAGHARLRLAAIAAAG